MATSVGDQIDDLQLTVANNAFLDTLSVLSGTQEAIVQNVFASGQISITWYDGTNEFIYETSPSGSAAAYLNMTWRSSKNSGRRIRVKNVSGGSISIGWSGVLSHT
jgi:flagellar hook assembly protein FlgD